jgi:hypothetical protein
MVMAKIKKTKGGAAGGPPEEKWVSRTVRMPQSVWDAIDDAAELNRRSGNQQLLWLVEQALRAERGEREGK